MSLSVHEYLQCDATALAELVRRGDVSPGELLDLADGQLQRLNPLLKAGPAPSS